MNTSAHAPRLHATLAFLLLAVGLAAAAPLHGQGVRIGDLTRDGDVVPVRLVGYGLVTGLDGTGDRAIGGFGSGHTVRSVANLLRRFGVEVPEGVLRTLNVAAVLVTAEISPYERPGGRFDINVASMGDATSLRGGVLWMTPLVPEAGAVPVATAQGPVVISGSDPGNRARSRAARVVETSGRVPEGGLVEQPVARPDEVARPVLTLRQPDLATAVRIAQAVNAAVGDGTASVADPGAVQLDLSSVDGLERMLALAEIQELEVTPRQVNRVVIDSRDGTVVTGGAIRLGAAVVSHDGITLSIAPEGVVIPEVEVVQDPGVPAGQTTPLPEAAGEPDAALPTGPFPRALPAQPVAAPPSAMSSVTMSAGVTIQELAAALSAVDAPPATVAAIFEALARVGAIRAQVVVR
jgi:flagellar P-ring protein precursor FlgI